MSKNQNHCLEKVLKVIALLQERAEEKEEKFEGCDKPFLGERVRDICFNTRPVMLFMRSGEKLTTKDEHGTESIFRVEKVHEHCAEVRVLRRNNKSKDKHHRFIATNEFVTVNLGCICAVKCLDDAIVENI